MDSKRSFTDALDGELSHHGTVVNDVVHVDVVTKVWENQLIELIVKSDSIPVNIVGSDCEIVFIHWILEVDECDLLSVIWIHLAGDEIKLNVEGLTSNEIESGLSKAKSIRFAMDFDCGRKIGQVDDLNDALFDAIDVAITQIHDFGQEIDERGAYLRGASLDQLQSG